MTFSRLRRIGHEGSSRKSSPTRHGRARLLTPAALIGVAWLAAALVAASAHAALPVCTASISACCQITTPGTYDFTGTVTASAGGDCIKVTVPGVVLNLDNNFLEGSNQSTPVGTGIHVLAAAPGTVVNGGVDFTATTPVNIAYFATGIQNDAAGATFEDFFVLFSGGNGVVNNGANTNFVGFWSNANGRNGVVDGASGTLFFSFQALQNDGSGVVLKSAPPPAPPEGNVRMSYFQASGNTGKAAANSGYGVVLSGEVGDDLEAFTAWNNAVDGVLIKAGGGNKLGNFSAGSASSQNPSGNGSYGLELVSTAGNFVDNFETSSNGKGGVRVELANANRIGYFSSFSNTGPGVWLDSAARNTVNDGDICGNSTSGVYIGCAPGTLPSGTSCGAAPHSNGNLVADTLPQSNDVGIAIDTGNHRNRVLVADTLDLIGPNPPCDGADSPGDDLVDENPNCDSNLWIYNRVNSESQGCIH